LNGPEIERQWITMSDKNDDSSEAIAPDDSRAAREAAERLMAESEVNIFEGVRQEDGGPVLPVRLKPEDMFCLSCHRDVPCWNACCYGADVTLTPYDILRLKGNLGLPTREFLERYTYSDIWPRSGLPVAKLQMGADGKGACGLLDEEAGCTVYADRPSTCRYYPLGLGAIKLKDAEEGQEKMDFHFLVKEPHCKGHDEEKLQSVAQFRTEQGIEPYDRMNRGWIDIQMKMASWKTIGGPQGRDLSEQTKRMFFMVSTDVDEFRRFVFGSKFLDTYYVEDATVALLQTDDEALLQLGFDWLKNVMFNEPTISLRKNVLQAAIARTRGELGAV